LNSKIIGKVTEDKMLRVKNNDRVVAEIPASTLVLGGDAPVYIREKRKPTYLKKTSKLNVSKIKPPGNLNEVLLSLLSSPNISSKKWVFEQYDTMVRTGTAVGPGSDSAVLRIRKSKKGLAISTDCNPRYCYLNPREGGRMAVAEAARNVVCSGAKPVAITNCLNFGNPYKPEMYWTFAECVYGMGEACRHFETPVTGGNVSFYNEDPQGAVYPTPVIGMLGILEDMRHATTQWFKKEGDLIGLLGENKNSLDGSEYLKVIHNLVKGNPKIDLREEKKVQKTCLEAIKKGIIKSAHDCAEGGLAVALAECCVSSPKSLGATINLNEKIRVDALLFGESPSRIILSLKEKDLKELKKISTKNMTEFSVIGKVGGKKLKINSWIDLQVEKMRRVYEESIPKMMEKVT